MGYRPALLRDELRYLRREGNRRVRMQRRRRNALRGTLLAILAALTLAAGAGSAGLAARWLAGDGRFPLSRIEVRGIVEATSGEIEASLAEWRGANVLGLPLARIEQRIREHPWIGASGSVAIRRKLPGTLILELKERVPHGLALLRGEIWLLDAHGMPIDRHGPRYAGYDFPILKGIEPPATGPAGARERRELAATLAGGVAVTRALASRPAFYREVSEIDLSEPGMAILRLDDERYDLRVSRDDCLRNLDRFLELRQRIVGGDGSLEVAYVDLRWQDRIAVMPAATRQAGNENDGGR